MDFGFGSGHIYRVRYLFRYMSTRPNDASALKAFLYLRFQKPHTREKIVSMLTEGVLYLAKVKSLPSEEKKAVLLRTIKELIEETDLPQYSKDMLVEVVDVLGDSVVEGLVRLGKDFVSFAKRKCSGGCCPF